MIYCISAYVHIVYFCLYSYFLYEISHPSKSGVLKVSLADDPEAQVELPKSLCPSRAAIERVIIKVFRHSHCDVVITDRLRSLFSLKLWRMGNAIQGLGGLAWKRQYDKWKDLKWLIELVNEEVVLPHNCKVKQCDTSIQKNQT